MKKICMIACDNGLGHISRTVDIANLIKKKFIITLCSNKNKIRKFTKINFKILNFSVNQFTKKSHIVLKKNLIKKFDIIYTDNIILNNFLSKNLFVYANFFWHQILKVRSKNFKKIEEYLLKNKIRIIGNYMFQNIKGNFYFKKIGFIGRFNGIFKINNNILLSFGTANIHIKKKKLIINELNKILKDKKFSNYNFYLDKEYALIMSENKINNFKVFDYSKHMFSKMSLAIIKPGFGIINNCLKFGIPICPISIFFNNEFKQNLEILKKKRLILFQTSLKNLDINLKKNYKYKKLYPLFKRYKSLKWFGEREIVKILSR